MSRLDPSANVGPAPHSNRGVTSAVSLVATASDGPIFDAYCATVYAHPLLVLDHIEQGLMNAGFNTDRQDGPPVRFYASNELLMEPGGERHLSVRHGGQNGHPFVECKGAASAVVASVLREHFPGHAPSRIDSAYDLRGPTAFLDLEKLAHQFEAKWRLPLNYAGARTDNPNRGTTIYLGSRKSQAFVRIYQKGLQIAEQMGLVGDDIPDELRHWVRVELEYKPDKRLAREKATTLSPRALWGCSPWLREFAMLALAIDAERVKMTERRETNHDRAMRYLVRQYGVTIVAHVERLGSWEAFAEDLKQRVEVHLELEPEDWPVPA